jgi:1,4-dihydroxy-2-naphthoyl-CoA synthase
VALTFETRDAVGVATIDRPEAANAIDGAAMADLVDCFAAVDADPEVATAALDRSLSAILPPGGGRAPRLPGAEPRNTVRRERASR